MCIYNYIYIVLSLVIYLCFSHCKQELPFKPFADWWFQALGEMVAKVANEGIIWRTLCNLCI
jgi:hypothetical protein